MPPTDQLFVCKHEHKTEYRLSGQFKATDSGVLLCSSVVENHDPAKLEEQIVIFEAMAEKIASAREQISEVTVFIADSLAELDYKARSYLAEQLAKEPPKESPVVIPVVTDVSTRKDKLLHGTQFTDPATQALVTVSPGIEDSITQLEEILGKDKVHVIGWSNYWPTDFKYSWEEESTKPEKEKRAAYQSKIASLSEIWSEASYIQSIDEICDWIKALYYSKSDFRGDVDSLARNFTVKIKREFNCEKKIDYDSFILKCMRDYVLNECAVYIKMQCTNIDYQIYKTPANKPMTEVRRLFWKIKHEATHRAIPFSLLPEKKAPEISVSRQSSESLERVGQRKLSSATPSPELVAEDTSATSSASEEDPPQKNTVTSSPPLKKSRIVTIGRYPEAAGQVVTVSDEGGAVQYTLEDSLLKEERLELFRVIVDSMHDETKKPSSIIIDSTMVPAAAGSPQKPPPTPIVDSTKVSAGAKRPPPYPSFPFDGKPDDHPPPGVTSFPS